MFRREFGLIMIMAVLIAITGFAGSKTDLAIESKVVALLSEMTLEEKIGQMAQRTMRGTAEDWEEAVSAGRVGSFLNAGNWIDKNKLQNYAVKKSRLGIPLIFGRDVIHGYQTMLPIPVAMASSFNPDLLEKGSGMAAAEASADGQHWTFAPMVDITRDPRWGRIAETCGEDPYLASMLGAAAVRGFQGDLSDPSTIAACAKHYAGYGAAEGGRDYNTTWIPERELRDVYLPSFKACVDAGVATLMSAFNDINGVPASGNYLTLTQVLRNEWGFDGFVVSDWGAMTEMINHGFCEDNKETAFKSVTAGIDMEMVTRAYEEELARLVRDGKVCENLINERVANILRIKYKLGLFDNPYNKGNRRKILLSAEHMAIAKEAAIQSAVLLKNKGVLPLSSTKAVAVIGPLADSPVDQMGMWTMDGVADAVVTPLKAIRDLVGVENVKYAAGLKTSRDSSTEGFAEAIEAAGASDVALLFVGEEMILSGEAKCRAFLNLPGAQTELIKAVEKTGKPVVLVMMAGRPLTFYEEEPLADAILWAWHNGTMGGPAIADLLFGKVSPSGKLPVTFPRTVGQIPIYYSKRNTGRPPSPDQNGIPIGTPIDPQGYNSKYLDVDWTPAYPFGYGLSYTTFEYSNLKLSSDKVSPCGSITVSADIKNSGTMEATEIVQLYIRDRFASVTRPVKELKGFKRITLKPGETQSVSFELEARDCGFHGLENQYTVEPGLIYVWIAPNSDEGLEGQFDIVKDCKCSH